MAVHVYDATVKILQPQPEGTLVGLNVDTRTLGNTNENPSLLLEPTHPTYATILSLLVSSAVNKKQVKICCAADTHPFETIQWVSYGF